MEKPLFIIILHIGFSLWESCSGFPIDFPSGSTGVNPVWLSSSFLAIGFLIVTVGIIFGCVCCRNGKGFQEFSNSNGSLSVPANEGFVNPTASSELTIFPPYSVATDASNRSSIVRFEPLPDLKTLAPNLRPAAFSYGEREISSQDWFHEPHNNFPRNQLKYLQEYGRGWFGRVVEGEAQNIVPQERLTKVIVKILHEDATPTDQMYFLHEVKFYRDLKHPNVLKLLGRCLETEPFLILLESCPNGDLKSFLTQNLASARALTEQGVTLKMCCNITSGLQYMHENKFIHTDLAARNCLVGPDLTIKIGDYGNSIEVFKSDYYCAGSVALPVRWCAPETLKCTDVTIETKEVTPLANVWTLGIVIWEICEFCKLPYGELNDDQVIVRVLGEKNYFLQKPTSFCLFKEELFHLMKLCWNPPLQRPTASQIRVILENLISSNRSFEKDVRVDPKRTSHDFEQRWRNSKPNYIPKTDNAVEADETSNVAVSSPKFKGAKVADSSHVESPLGFFTSKKGGGQDSPRFCLKSEKSEPEDEEFAREKEAKPDEDSEYRGNLKKSDSVKNLSGSLDRLNDAAKELEDEERKMDFDYNAEIKPPEILKPGYKLQEPDVDSWLKGVEVNNEEDETFVRKISEAIRDLDAALAMEKTSSSEENSGKSSHQNSPGKELKPAEPEPVVDFKLGDASSFMSFTPKSFELSSLQNTEQPQSLNLTDYDNYGQDSLIFPIINESKNSFKFKNNIFDDSLKENDSFQYAQSRNSSDTEDEMWRKRIERGEFSEKVKEKSKSIADLMVLTHIDASDDSDVDNDKNFDRNLNRNSFFRRSGSNPRSSLTSNNFGSESDITNAVLEDDFKESLKKLSNDHKEHGKFDSLNMILPNRRDFFKAEDSTNDSRHSTNDSARNFQSEPSEIFRKSPNSRNHFLVDVASEILIDNSDRVQDGASRSILNDEKLVGLDFIEQDSNCDNADSSSSHLDQNNCTDNDTTESIDDEQSFNSIKNVSSMPIINVTEVDDDKEERKEEEEVFESSAKKIKPFRFVMKDSNDDSVPEINVTEAKDEFVVDDREEETFETVFSKKSYRFCFKETEDNNQVPEIKITEEIEDDEEEAEETFEFTSTERKSFRFVIKEDAIEENQSVPNISEVVNQKTEPIYEAEDTKKTNEAKPETKDENKEHEKLSKNVEESTVIIGACEEYTLGYFQGLKTTFGNFREPEKAEDETKLKEIMDNLMSKESNLENWDEHLEKSFTQQFSNTNFDDISFPSLSLESAATDNPASEAKDLLGDSFNSTPMSPNRTIVTVLENENVDKIEESMHINGITNLNGNNSEEEYENGKLRTPDDERSSDSGFRDKGSLSESVEDACEGKYNLEDIEAELEEAYVKGAFGNETDSKKSSNNFDYEESKFYEDENKNDEDFSDIDGEIEYWHNKENNEYYPEISEFSPVNSKGWYLHPPDDSSVKSNDGIDEEFVNALRNELKEKLPTQSRKFEELDDFYFDYAEETDAKVDINVQYTNNFATPLSPILEEDERSFFKESVKCPSPEVNEHRIKKNVTSIMESVKLIDTDTFAQYLDYLIENEGRDIEDEEKDIMEEEKDIMEEEKDITEEEKDVTEEEKDVTEEEKDVTEEEKDITEEIVQIKDEEINKPIFIITRDDKTDETFEQDIKNALGVENVSGSDSLISETEQPKSIVLFEDLESNSKCKIIEETKPDDDILMIDTETNEMTMLESPKPKSYVAFVENEADDVLEITTDDSENEAMIYTPDSISPTRERSLSDTSGSSNGTGANNASSDITLSSPDFLSDYFLTPNSEKSPADSPRRLIPKISETRVQEIVENNEANEIINELKSSGILNEACSSETLDSCVLSEDSLEKNERSLPYIVTKSSSSLDFFLRSERTHTSNLLEESSRKLQRLDTVDSLGANVSDLSESNEISTSCSNSPNVEERLENKNHFEMSTSFMNEEEEEEEEKMEINDDKEEENYDGEKTVADECYTPDWESESDSGEEASSSSGEFIWKDGDKESKVKVVQATDNDVENSLYEKSQSDNSTAEPIDDNWKKDENGLKEEEDEDDDESSTGSSASITDFVPSAWNSQATPSRPALRSPDKKTEQQKRNVWFKKQKYHCVYEYPREPSDTEDVETSPYKHFNYGINMSDVPNKHFSYGINATELPNKHFTYGISNLIDYSKYADWDVLDGDDGDLSLTDTDSDNGSGKSNKSIPGKVDYNFYNLSMFDYDFNNSGMLSDDGEFFVSSSARPFQGSSSSQFFPGSGKTSVFTGNEENATEEDKQQSTAAEESLTSTPSPLKKSNDFVTPDSGVDEDSTISTTPTDKKTDDNDQITETENENNEDIINILENLKFNFAQKIVDEDNDKKNNSEEAFKGSSSSSPNDLSSSNSPSSPLSPTGLGELRHTRDKLKLDLSHNHNAELGLVLNNKKTNKIH